MSNSTSASAWACASCGQVACACTLYSPGDLDQGTPTDIWGCNACGQVACTCTLYSPGDLTPNAGNARRLGRR